MIFRSDAKPKGTAASRRWRRLLWTFALLAAGSIAGCVAAARGTLPDDLNAPLGLAAGAAVLGALLCFRQGTAESRAERETIERHQMLLIVAAQLKTQDDATLAGIAARGGPAGEAAEMLLSERRRKAAALADAPAGSNSPTTS